MFSQTFSHNKMHAWILPSGISTNNNRRRQTQNNIPSTQAPTHSIYMTRSDKTSLITRKYTHVYNGIYLLFCRCYSNFVSFIELLRSFASYMVKFMLKYCIQKKSY